MISLSILLDIPNGDIAKHLKILGIKQENISSYDKETRFLETRENGALVEHTQGDFTHAVDLYIFDRDMQSVEKSLAEISSIGPILAMPDETQDDPEAYVLWRNGDQYVRRIFENDTGLWIKDSLGKAEFS